MSVPGVIVHADDTIVEAARTMAHSRVERLPVVDEEDRVVVFGPARRFLS